MSVENSSLCVVNVSGMNIISIKVTEVDNYDWEGQDRPDHNFQGVSIQNNDALCQPETMNSHANTSPCRLTLSFTDGSTLTFRFDQKQANTKYNRMFSASGPATNRLDVVQSSGGGTNAFYIQPKQLPDNTGWMGKLAKTNPAVTINALTMPGSHDAGMFEITDTSTIVANSWALTQQLSIFDQLKAGSRYFDLRIRHTSKGFYTGHYSDSSSSSIGLNGASLKSVLDQAYRFISQQAASGEVVFFKFSHTEDNTNLTNLINEISNGLKDRMFKTNDTSMVIQKQKLTDLAGRVVCLFDDEFSSKINFSKGVFKYIDIPDPSTKMGIPQFTVNEPGAQVFDHYSDSNSLATMSSDQLVKLKIDGGYNRNYLFLLSWTLTGSFTSSVKDVQVLSTMCNPWLPTHTSKWRKVTQVGLIKTHPTRANIVYFDFITPCLCSCIIEANYLLG